MSTSALSVLYYSRKPTIYFDMDNTVALFCKYGEDALSLAKVHKKGFFRHLAPVSGCKIIIPMLQEMGFRVRIISSCAETPYCRREKREWIHEHLPSIDDSDIVFCRIGQNKAKYVYDIKNSILVDDYDVNLEDWTRAGGIAIKKRNSTKPSKFLSISSHYELFDVLDNLGYLRA